MSTSRHCSVDCFNALWFFRRNDASIGIASGRYGPNSICKQIHIANNIINSLCYLHHYQTTFLLVARKMATCQHSFEQIFCKIC